MSHNLISGQTGLKFGQGVMLCMLLAAFCSCGDPTASNIDISPSPNPAAPLAGMLTFTTDRPVVPTLTIEDSTHKQVVTPDPEFRKEHEIWVLGLRPGRTHTVIVTIRDKRGNEVDLEPLEISTPPLPLDFPKIEVVVADTASMEPGITIFDMFRWEGKFKDDPKWSLAAGLDQTGEVVWYWKTNFWIGEVRRMNNGNLKVYGKDDGRLMEVDMFGRTIREWYTSGVIQGDLPIEGKSVDTDGFHHDVVQKKNGDFIGLGTEVKSYSDFPLAYPPEDSIGPGNVVGDVIIEFDHEGNTLRKWSVIDIIDPYRLGVGSLNTGFYGDWYEDRYDTLSIPFDITHCNALYYVEDEDALVVSSNHLCALFKIDMASGDLIWILGDSTGWKEPWSDKLLTVKGEVSWPCHQHGVEMTPRGTLLLFDNGGGRNIPPNEPMPEDEQYSQVVEYRVNEDEMTVEQVWSYGPEQERFLSPFISDADHLPETGNILVTDGARFHEEGDQWSRLFELTYPEKEKVWEVHFKSDKPFHGFSVYRGQRLKSLYPTLDSFTY